MNRRIISLFLSMAMMTPVFSGISLTSSADAGDVAAQQDPILPQEIYEAEYAQLHSASVETVLDDFSGDGYVDGLRTGSSVTFTVDVQDTADYGVTLRYSNGSGEPLTISVYANEKKVLVSKLGCTINWNTWGTQTENIPLQKGKNTITYRCEDVYDKQVALDRINLSRIYEAENAVLAGGLEIKSQYKGFSGDGYAANFMQNQSLTFTVYAEHEGDYTMNVHYGAGQTDSDARVLSLVVNGDTSQKEQLYFSSLRDWSVWADFRWTVHLKKGENQIAFSYGEKDKKGEMNIDYITIKPQNWSYAGEVKDVEGNGTEELTFTLENCFLRIKSVDENAVKVWLDKQGTFERKYESFSVVNDAVDPQKLNVEDMGQYYQFVTGEVTIRVFKNPMRLVYLDKNGNVILENDAKSLGWSTDGEFIVNHKLESDEQFWGLGETPVSFNRRGTRIALWGNDKASSRADSAVPETVSGDGRWYMNNPYFISSKGYSILFDNSSRTVFDFGKTDTDISSFGSLNPNPGGELIYYFIYGPDMKQETKTLSDITGKSFFAPEWGYGNLQSHWGYTQEDMERVAQTYRDKNIPLDCIIADIEWYEYYCTPTQWNETNFPDPEGMIQKLKDLNLHIGVIDDPNITSRDNNADFQYGSENNFFLRDANNKTKLVTWPWGSASGLPDFFDPLVRDWWGELHNNVISQGIDFFWMDMNEPARYNNDWYYWNEDGKSYGTTAELKNVYAQMQQRAMFDKMTENGERSMMLTRSGYQGTYRYAAPWTGDIGSDWNAMKQQISLGLGLSMNGYHYWTYDIGGSAGALTDEQFQRWVETAVFIPVTRYHATAQLEQREAYTHGAEDIARKYISLRYQLIPYMYSMTADSIIGIGIENGYGEGGTGLPVVRPMVMEYPNDQNTWNMAEQYMCGTSFLVAPVMESSDTKNVYLPEGKWYDYQDGKTVYDGNQTIEYYAPIDVLPVFVKEGSIIPMQPVMQYVDELPLDELTLDIYPTTSDGDYSFVFYEDDGETLDYLDGEYATTPYTGFTRIDDETGTGRFGLVISSRRGDYKDEVTDRDYMLKFHVADYDNITVEKDGSAMVSAASLDALNDMISGYYMDAAAGVCYVKFADTAEEMKIVVTGENSAVRQDVYEAEDASLVNVSVTNNIEGYEGTGYVDFTSAVGAVTFENVNAEADGNYALYLRYQTASDKVFTAHVTVNDQPTRTVDISAKDVAAWEKAIAVVSLQQGTNTITVSGLSPDISLDNIRLAVHPIAEGNISTSDAVFEAEDAVLAGNAGVSLSGYTNFSGRGFTEGFDQSGDGVSFENISVPVDGTYAVRIRFANTSGSIQTLSVTSGDSSQQISFARLKKNEFWDEAIVNIPLKQGTNTITIGVRSGDSGNVCIDRITIPAIPCEYESVPITNMDFETGTLDGWTLSSNASDQTSGVDKNDPFSGDYKFYLYTRMWDMKQSVSRTFSGLENGEYLLTMWIKVFNNAPREASLILSGYDGTAETTVDFSFDQKWVRYEVPVTVKDGMLTMMIYQDAPSNSTIQVDEINLYKVSRDSADWRTALVSKIETEKSVVRGEYTEESWNSFQEALQLGEIAANDSEATVFRAIVAENHIDEAKSALTTKEPDPQPDSQPDPQPLPLPEQLPISPVDKSALNAALANAPKDLSIYTQLSAALYEKRLAAAEAVADDQAVTQRIVDDALTALAEAEESLRLPTTSANLALGADVYTSVSNEGSYIPQYMVDGNETTRWASSNGGAAQTITLDLRSIVYIRRIVVLWESMSNNFTVELSTDNENWITVVSDQQNISAGTGVTTEYDFPLYAARYVRLHSSKGAPGIGTYLSIYEIEAYGNTEKPEVDKTKLNAAIETAVSDLSKYTEDSAQEYSDALNTAIEVAQDYQATQEAVDAALLALENAQDALIEKADAPIKYTKGDSSGDGQINSTDFTQVRRYFLGLYEMTETQKLAADVDEDGSINSTDFTQIRRHFLGLYEIGA